MLSIGSLALLILTIGLIVSWIISALFIWFAAKIVTGKRATFGRSLLAALLGSVMFFIFYAILSEVLLFVVGVVLAYLISVIITFLILSALYRSIFRTHLLGGALIALFVIIIAYVVVSVLGAIL